MRKWEQLAKSSAEGWSGSGGEISIVSVGRNWNGKTVISRRDCGNREKKVEDFCDHVAADGSLVGVSSKLGACGWLVTQLDYDQGSGPMHGMSGAMQASIEVTAF